MARDMKPVDKAISLVGSLSELSSLLGVSPQVVSNWRLDGRNVPVERCIDIEKATNGMVRCEELRGDIDWSYLRGSEVVHG